MPTMTTTKPTEQYAVNPKRFVLWLSIVSICMLFAGLTSGYIVRRAEGNWENFALPTIFTYSTIVALLGSITMLWAQRSAKHDELDQLRLSLSITFGLGLVFCIMQFMGWTDLVSHDVYFTGNPSGSFVYALSGIHLAHVLGGMIAFIFILVKAFRNEIHKMSREGLGLLATYWHFVGILWIYLFLFLFLTR